MLHACLVYDVKGLRNTQLQDLTRLSFFILLLLVIITVSAMVSASNLFFSRLGIFMKKLDTQLEINLGLGFAYRYYS